MVRPSVVLLAAGLAWGQQVPKAQVEYGCVPEDLDTAGLTCSPNHPCTVFLELAAIETVGIKIFLTGNLHTTDTTLASVLLTTDDGGRTWTEPHARAAGAGIEQIQFVDYQNGWISGQSLQGRPRDPFLLITHDGGKTWMSRPVFDETRVGIIQQFWFDSKTTGGLLFDRMQPNESGSRYELYESQTGGESWTLREVSARQLSIRRSRAGQGNPDWRIRADASSKSYVIEQRQGEKWRGVSVFPIVVAECKGAETRYVEPVPEQETPAAPAKPVVKKRKN